MFSGAGNELEIIKRNCIDTRLSDHYQFIFKTDSAEKNIIITIIDVDVCFPRHVDICRISFGLESYGRIIC